MSRLNKVTSEHVSLTRQTLFSNLPAESLKRKILVIAILILLLIVLSTWVGLATLRQIRSYQDILSANTEQHLLLIDLVKTIDLALHLDKNTPSHRLNLVSRDIVEKNTKIIVLENKIISFSENVWINAFIGRDIPAVQPLPQGTIGAFKDLTQLISSEIGGVEVTSISFYLPGEISLVQRSGWTDTIRLRTSKFNRNLQFWFKFQYFGSIIYSGLLLTFIVTVAIFVLRPSISALVRTAIKQMESTRLQVVLAQYIQEVLASGINTANKDQWLQALNEKSRKQHEMENMRFILSEFEKNEKQPDDDTLVFHASIPIDEFQKNVLAIEISYEHRHLAGSLVPFLNVLTLGSQLIIEKNLRELVEIDRDNSVELSWAVTQASHNPIILFSNDEVIVAVNQAACDFFKVDQHALVGEQFDVLGRLNDELVDNHASSPNDSTFFSSASDDTAVFNYENNRSVEWRRNGTSEIGGFFSAFDITEFLSRLDEKEKRNRLEIIGRISSTISHDTNNFLATIYSGLEVVLLEDGITNSGRSLLESALQSCEGASHINKNLLDYSAKQDLMPTNFKIAEIYDDLRKYILARSGNITFVVSSDYNPTVCLDRVFLINAMQNIIENSLAAIKNVGTIKLTVLKHDENNVCIRLCDDGSGFSDEALKSGFLPYFSQRELGSGLGLSSVEGFARQSGGNAKLYNNAGGCVELYLPLRSESDEVSRLALSESKLQPINGERHILVVEDNIGLLNVLNEWLMIEGWRVHCAGSLEDAFKALGTGDVYNAVLVDVRLEDGSGINILDVVAKRSPKPILIAMSGFGNIMLFEDREYELNFLKKPFVLSELASLLN